MAYGESGEKHAEAEMKISKTRLCGPRLIEPEIFSDSRGAFGRIFCKRELENLGFSGQICQINHSYTVLKGTVRGMHFQLPPAAETKFVKCIRGSAHDVIIDLRENSFDFLKWESFILSDKNRCTLMVPEGFAHGFQTLEDNCEMLYLHSEFYSSTHEKGIRYDDPAVGINWPLPVSCISEKDLRHPLLDGLFKGVKP